MNTQKLLMAFMVPLAFVACSEIDDMVPNAPSDEQKGLSSSGDDIIASSSSSLEGNSDAVYTGMKVYVTDPNQYITIAELNPETLENLYDVFYGSRYLDDGTGDKAHVVEGLSLKSPYVKVGYGRDCRPYNIVDLRESDAVAVNEKTYFESIRALHLMKSGKSFSDAKKQAGREFFEAFGANSALCDKDETTCMKNKDYSDYIRFVANFAEYSTEDTLVARFEKCGNLTCDEEAMKKRYMTEISDLVWNSNVEGSSDDERSYLGDFYAKLIGDGSCTAENEGKSYEMLRSVRAYLPVVMSCHSGKWKIAYKEMEHTMGTMTDERNGKTYKTVTYDLNGTTQTWLAERLAYALDGLQVPCEEDSALCGSYFIENALNVDSSLVYPSADSCMKLKFSECTWCSEDATPENFKDECRDRSDRYISLKSVAVVESVMKEKGVYQGICPDGWHIPTFDELNKLLDYLLEFYKPMISESAKKEIDEDEKRSWVYELLNTTALGDPIGFGLDRYSPGFFAIEGSLPLPVFNFGYSSGEYAQISAFVRCVKD